jgi:hypothetical protein
MEEKRRRKAAKIAHMVCVVLARLLVTLLINVVII